MLACSWVRWFGECTTEGRSKDSLVSQSSAKVKLHNFILVAHLFTSERPRHGYFEQPNSGQDECSLFIWQLLGGSRVATSATLSQVGRLRNVFFFDIFPSFNRVSGFSCFSFGFLSRVVPLRSWLMVVSTQTSHFFCYVARMVQGACSGFVRWADSAARQKFLRQVSDLCQDMIRYW